MYRLDIFTVDGKMVIGRVETEERLNGLIGMIVEGDSFIEIPSAERNSNIVQLVRTAHICSFYYSKI